MFENLKENRITNISQVIGEFGVKVVFSKKITNSGNGIFPRISTIPGTTLWAGPLKHKGRNEFYVTLLLKGENPGGNDVK